MDSGIKDHAFWTKNIREHFLEDELALNKSKLLEMVSLVELEWTNDWNKIVIKMVWKQFVARGVQTKDDLWSCR